MSARQPWAAAPPPVCIEHAGRGDRARLARFLAAMDKHGLYQRHFGHGEAHNLALLARLEAADGIDRVVVLASGADGEVLGHGEYVASGGSAEYALMVLPGLRGMGLGGSLLAELMESAQAAGQREMRGIIQAGNTQALRLARNRGFRIVPGEDRDTVTVVRDLVPAFAHHSRPTIPDDAYGTSLHRRPGKGAPLWPRGGQVQRGATNAFGGCQEA